MAVFGPEPFLIPSPRFGIPVPQLLPRGMVACLEIAQGPACVTGCELANQVGIRHAAALAADQQRIHRNSMTKGEMAESC